jgi:hypothetical protein
MGMTYIHKFSEISWHRVPQEAFHEETKNLSIIYNPISHIHKNPRLCFPTSISYDKE